MMVATVERDDRTGRWRDPLVTCTTAQLEAQAERGEQQRQARERASLSIRVSQLDDHHRTRWRSS